MSGTFKIEARSRSILGAASHDFWVLRDSNGNKIAELDGLAYDRDKGEVVPVGTTSNDSLRFYQKVFDSNYINLIGDSTTGVRYQYEDGQSSQIVFSGTQEQALARWNAAGNAIPFLNSLDLDYPPFGFDITVPTVNSNSAYRTFGELMGLEPFDFPWTLEPGFDYRVITPETIETLKYKPGQNEFSGNSQSKLSYLLCVDNTALVQHNEGNLIGQAFNTLTTWITDSLIGLGSAIGNIFSSISNFFSPIGAFYDSQSYTYDNALSIAAYTPVLEDANGNPLSAAQLAALDANGDGRVDTAESGNLRFWQDLNENGQAEAGELTGVNRNIAALDYSFYTRSNGRIAPAAPAEPQAVQGINAPAQSVPDSNYRTLRDTDNVFYTSGGWIDWSSSQIKINNNSRDTLVGTDGNDSFDANYYAAYPQYFDTSLLTRFLAGAGDDIMGGSTRNDSLWGGEGHDTLLGYAGDDMLYGEQNNDELQGGDGSDTLDGGIGDDRLFGQAGADTLFGDAGLDELQGGDGNDQLLGGADNDRLFGQTGYDILWGGDGNDLLVGFTAGNEAKQSLNAGEGDDDILFGENGNDNLYGGLGTDYLDGGSDDDILLGQEDDDRLYGGGGSDELQGGDGSDRLQGDAGDDKLFGQTGNDSLWGGDGNDILVGFTAGNETKQWLNAGESDDDILSAGAGSDILIGGFGQDTLYGGDGRDELQGGSGQDRLYGDDGSDNLFGQVGDDILYGGNGDDYLQGFTGNNEAQQSLNPGESDNDYLNGGAGNDTLAGGLGDDTLDGGAGADVMIGGQGNDTYLVNSVNDSIYEQADQGYDSVITNTNYLLNANIEELRLLEGFAINGTGNAQDNRIIGNSSDNILDGVTGADTMIGGLGNDIYYVDNLGDQVVENAGEGADTVQSSISYALGDNTENLILLDFAKPEKGLVDGRQVLVFGYPKRNELDYMQGDAVPNYLGTCALTSIANLLTQTGRPTTESQVVSLAINNNWAVNNPNLPAYQLGGSNVNDQRNILNSYQIRNDVIVGYNENGLANLIRSGRGVIISVNAGALWGEPAYSGDGGINHAITLTGVVYNETDGSLAGFYVADSGRGKVSDMTRFLSIDVFRQAANVPYAYAIYTLEPVKFWEENLNGAGNSADNTLVGNRGVNVLEGLAGNDILDGGAGVDTLIGGLGDDTYVVDNTGDIVSETSTLATEIDTVQAGISYTLGANVENLTLTGADNLDATGNELNNLITGNAGNNRLDGAAGADRMVGGLGDDTYIVDNINDIVSETSALATEIDSIQSSVNYTLGTYLENLSLTGTATVNGTGNALNNELTGNSAANVLDGGAGADTLIGGLGDDTYVVDNIGDVVSESAGEGIDTVQSGISYTLGANIENLTLSSNINYISVRAGQTDLYGMFGFRSDPATGSGYTALDYAWLPAADGHLYIYENGVSVGGFGTYTTADILSIAYEGSSVRYLKNGVLQHTTTTGEGRTFYFDSTLYDPGYSLNDIHFGASSLATTSSAVTVNGNTFTKTGAVAAWGDADAYSKTGLTGGAYASAQAGQTNLYGMFGLNSDPRTGSGYASLDYAWLPSADGHLYIYESGVYVGGFGAYSTTDTLAVAYEGSTVRYLKNGVLQHTSSTTEGRTFYFDSTLYDSGYTLNAIQFGASSLALTNDIQLSASNLATTSAAVTITGNSFTKTGTVAAWGDADAYSKTGLTGSAYVSAQAGQTGLYGMFGLNSDPTTGSDYASLDYAWLPSADGHLYIYESGVYVGAFGAYTTADILSVAYEGSTVRYLKNGVLQHTTGTGAGRTFYFDSTLYNPGYTLNNIQFGSAGLATTSSAVTLSGNTLTKTGAVAAWGDADAYSKTGLTGGAYVSAQAGQTGLYGMFGLNSDPTTGSDYASLDYAWLPSADGHLYIYENGACVGGFGAYTTTDILSVVYEGSSVRYLKNGVLQHTTTTGAGRTFYFDSTLYNPGYTLNNIQFGSASLATTSSAITVNGNSFTKSGAVAAWGDADAYSKTGLTGGAYASAQAGQTNLYGMFGLNSDPTTGSDYASLDYAWLPSADGHLYIYENGACVGGFGAYSTTDTLAVAYEGDTVRYLKNGVLQHTTGTGEGRTFYFDSTLYNSGYTLNNIQFGASSLATTSLTKSGGASTWEDTYSMTGLTANASNGTGNELDNILVGNNLANTLSGEAGNDCLEGGAGADTLIGGTGNDTYLFGRGYGTDTVHDHDAGGNTDTLRFAADIASDQLWLRQAGNDLEISVIGSADTTTVADWYLGSAYRIEQIDAGDGKRLTDANVDALVQAMAAFAPPSAGQSMLPQDYRTALAPVLAANWQ